MEQYTSRYHETVAADANLPPVQYQSPRHTTGKGFIQSTLDAVKKYKVQMLSYMLCSAGLLWQLSTLSTSYFQYQMISKVSYMKNDTVIPPAMSICLPFPEMIDLNKVGWNELNLSSHEEQARFLRSVTVRQVFDATPHFRELISDAWMRERNSFGIDHSLKSFQIDKFTKNDDVCYRIQNRYADDKGFSYKSHQISFGVHPGIIFFVGFNKSKISGVTEADIYLHESEKYPRGDRDFPIYLGGTKSFVDSNAQSLWGISQVKETFHLLPSPFETNCKDYKLNNYETEYHCIYDCISQRFIKKFNKTVFTAVHTEPNDDLTITRDEIIEQGKLQTYIDDSLKKCKNDCPGSSCTKVYFIPMIIDTRDYDSMLVFQLFDMNGLEMIADFSPKTALADFTVQALSVSGVWLGISCHDIVFNILKWIVMVSFINFSHSLTVTLLLTVTPLLTRLLFRRGDVPEKQGIVTNFTSKDTGENPIKKVSCSKFYVETKIKRCTSLQKDFRREITQFSKCVKRENGMIIKIVKLDTT